MEFDKSQILSMIGDAGLAQQAEQQLPDVIDHEAHGDLLQQFGIDPGQLVEQQVQGEFGGGQDSSGQ